MDDIYLNNISDLKKWFFPLKEYCLFLGQANSQWQLEPSFLSKSNNIGDLNNFYIPEDNENTLESISTCLDFSYNFWIALFISLEQYKELPSKPQFGSIWVLDYKEFKRIKNTNDCMNYRSLEANQSRKESEYLTKAKFNWNPEMKEEIISELSKRRISKKTLGIL
jgi:hypothetical protein